MTERKRHKRPARPRARRHPAAPPPAAEPSTREADQEERPIQAFMERKPVARATPDDLDEAVAASAERGVEEVWDGNKR